MKILLTSGGITNKSIARSLRRLLGKPFEKSKLVFIPTAANIQPGGKEWLINDLLKCDELGWREINILNIDATPQEKVWKPRVVGADVLLFGGGNSFYLVRWLRKSGFTKILRGLLKTKVYVGISAGSVIAAPNLSLSSGRNRDLFKIYYEGESRTHSIERGLGLVNFYVRPHFNSPHFPHARKENIRKFAEKIKEPVYAIDDESAVEVIDGKARVVSEGKYFTFNAPARP